MSDLIMVSAADMAVLNLLRSYAPLRRELERAIVVSSAAMPPDVATLDSRVRYMDETEGVTRTVSLVYPSQADAAKGKVSVLAPVGTALLGLSEGVSIEWEVPARRAPGAGGGCAGKGRPRARGSSRSRRPSGCTAGRAAQGRRRCRDSRAPGR